MIPGPPPPGRPAQRRPAAGRRLLAAALLMPAVEIAVAYAVARQLGVGWTLLALVGLSVIGVVVLRRAARAAFVALGPVPGSPVGGAVGPVTGASSARGADLALEAAGGVLLALPGFVSAAFGALLVLPPVRRLLRPLLGAGAARLVTAVMRRSQVRVVTGETVDVRDIKVSDLDVPGGRGGSGRVTDAGPGRRPALPGEVVDPGQQ